ncbi:hypothetical protein BHU72_02670 [Desulfuribacillus stibiiarsenatis]|uniref:Segregation and condensation protein A n=1 Tax=Desulfuribacillus stibiiarsenatis TaxID=1390249 RepID=A0A1E5L6E8_9FIRM|nr:segregation/condensation protein A [Desulfuribacillus stibiiarsenatis]OEH85715.1 hypothetical protein BHU72_02670 [Desulfuribacillus stibiiarsenatis]
MAYSVRLDSFEGPLDLLLYLIEQAEVDIYDISIAEITQQYLDYLKAMKSLELDIASEFILMAATLLSMKSRKLLPKPIQLQPLISEYVEEIDPQVELMNRLIEYKKYKKIAEYLREKESKRSLYFSKLPSNLEQFYQEQTEQKIDTISVYDLVSAFIHGIHRKYQVDPIATIQKEEVSVDDKISQIRSFLSINDSIAFSKLVSRKSVSEVVVTLLAILELMKTREVTCIQDQLFEDFIIMVMK